MNFQARITPPVSRAIRALARDRAQANSLFLRIMETAQRRPADDAWCQANTLGERPGAFQFPISIVAGDRRSTYRVIAERDTATGRVFVLQLLEVRPF